MFYEIFLEIIMELKQTNSNFGIEFDKILDKAQRLSQMVGFDYLSVTQKGKITPSDRE